MAKEIIFNLKLNDNLDKTNKSIDELISGLTDADQKFGELEKAARNAALAGDQALSRTYAEAAGNIKRAIDETNASIDNFASKTRKLDFAVGTAEGIAGAFATVQGTMALLGQENKELEKTLLKVQGSLAVLNGVQSISNVLSKESAVGAQLHAAANAILTGSIFTVNGALAAFRTALISTGIGAAVVGIGLLIAYWDDLAAAIGFATKSHQEFAKEQEELIIKGVTQAGKVIQRQIRLLESQGNKEKEIVDKKLELIDIEISALDMIEKSRKLTQDEQDRRADLLYEKEIIRNEERNRLLKKSEDEEKKRIENEQKLLTESQKFRAEYEKSKFELDAANRESEEIKAKHREESIFAEEEAELAKASAVIDANNAKIQSDRDAAAERIRIKLDENQVMADRTAQGFQLLTDINDIFYAGSEKDAKKRFENSKKIQIAQALISTYFAANQAYLSQFLPVPDPSSPVRGGIAAGLAVVSGLANVQKIRSQQFNGGGGGSDKPAPPPSGGVSAPSNPFSTSTPSQVINLTSRPTDTGAQRVYVLESDITNVQNKVSVIENNAKIV